MSSKAAVTALQRGKARITRGWCKGNWAQDRNGASVDTGSPDAVRFCVLGAVADASLVADAYLGRVAWMLRWPSAAQFNDAHGTELRHVLGLYDWAIALAEADAARSMREKFNDIANGRDG